MRKQSYTDSATLLLKHLDRMLDQDEGYPDPPTWGYAFTILAALQLNATYSSNYLAKKSFFHYKMQKKPLKGYSWEFTTYALYQCVRLSSSDELSACCVYKEKGTRMVNWTLLRLLNKLYFNQHGLRSSLTLRGIKKVFTKENGQILDELKTRSLQYHAFCLFVLAELDQTSVHAIVKDWLIKGCRFSINSILNDGTALYIGRGQEQIFGYGALIYSLEYVSNKYKLDFEKELDLIWRHLSRFQREDGSYPLVLNVVQPELPEVSYIRNKPNGWYGYNTLYDYQPFLAYCLLKAAKL